MKTNRTITLFVFVITFLNRTIFGATYYVDGTLGNEGNPGTSWTAAKARIQSGVNLASTGDTVLVTNGTYTLSSQISINNAVTVKSVNGANVTVVDGNYSCRCFSINHSNAVVDGFTIMRGHAPNESNHAYGGGVIMNGGGTLQDCIVVSNRAGSGGLVSQPWGGGVFSTASGKVKNCIIRKNKVESTNMDSGGGGAGINANDINVENCLITENEIYISNWDANGAGVHCGENSTILNCTIVSNACKSGGSQHGGGIHISGSKIKVYNCIIWGNTSANQPNWYASMNTGLFYCCTTPLAAGIGNIAVDPLLDSLGGWRLQSNSPCINTGSQLYRTGTDLDGKDRDPFAPDMGCYEYQANANFVSSGYSGSAPPSVQILSVSNRFRSNIVDIDYRVTDSDSPTVEVRGYAVVAPIVGPEYKYTDAVYPLNTMVEGTAAEYGSGVVPTNAVKRLSWDAGTDIGKSVAGLRIELMTSDTTNLPISLHLVTIPADTNGPAFNINRYSQATSEYQLRRSFLWSLCKGIASKNGSQLVAVGGTYNNQVIAIDNVITETGKLWLCENIGGVRLATAGEVQRAREATAGKVTQWSSYYRWGMKVNEFGIDTTDGSTWYLVKE